MADHETTSEPRKPRRRRRLGCLAAVGLLLLAMIAGGGVAYWLWSSEPGYVADNRAFLDAHEPEELEAIAAGLENRLARTLTALRPTPGDTITAAGSPAANANADGGNATYDELQASARRVETRELDLPVDEVNAWLATRGPQWLTHQGYQLPPQVSEPMLASRDGRPVVGFRYRDGNFSQWISLAVDARVGEDGRASLRVAEVVGGRLPVPIDAMFDRFEETAANRLGAERVRAVRSAIDGQAFDARFRLDRRVATVQRLVARPDGFAVTVRLEPITDANREAAEALPGL